MKLRLNTLQKLCIPFAAAITASTAFFFPLKQETAEVLPAPKTVNVIVVYHNPKVFINNEQGKRFHEIFGWNDPVELNRIYKDSLEAFSHGTIRYNIVKVIDEERLWTQFKDSTEHLSAERAYGLLKEKGWNELKKKETRFDYRGFMAHHGFGKLRDAEKVHEVWVWSWPYGGMYESQMAGEEAFWCNSPGLKTDNKKILTIMGFNFERTADLAIHSFGHRAESIMREVYGNWRSLKETENPNTWEKFTSLHKDAPANAHVGNCHFPPNGVKDYDYANKTTVNSYAYDWKGFPATVPGTGKASAVNCEDWGCSQMGYMSWWMRKFPHAAGVSKREGVLNNWWLYFAVYEEAVAEAKGGSFSRRRGGAAH